jgi:hypothetical protein
MWQIIHSSMVHSSSFRHQIPFLRLLSVFPIASLGEFLSPREFLHRDADCEVIRVCIQDGDDFKYSDHCV